MKQFLGAMKFPGLLYMGAIIIVYEGFTFGDCATIFERAQFNRKLYHKNITKCGVKQLKMKMSFSKIYWLFTLLVS